MDSTNPLDYRLRSAGEGGTRGIKEVGAQQLYPLKVLFEVLLDLEGLVPDPSSIASTGSPWYVASR